MNPMGLFGMHCCNTIAAFGPVGIAIIVAIRVRAAYCFVFARRKPTLTPFSSTRAPTNGSDSAMGNNPKKDKELKEKASKNAATSGSDSSEAEEEYIVEKILSRRVKHGKVRTAAT